jgi:hypothetical protein
VKREAAPSIAKPSLVEPHGHPVLPVAVDSGYRGTSAARPVLDRPHERASDALSPIGLRPRDNVDEQPSGSQLALDLPLSIARGLQNTSRDEPEDFWKRSRVGLDGEAPGLAPRADQPWHIHSARLAENDAIHHAHPITPLCDTKQAAGRDLNYLLAKRRISSAREWMSSLR